VVAGYAVQQLLSSGPRVRVHRAVRAATGEQVVLRVPREGVDLSSERSALEAVAGPHVVRLLDEVGGALVLELAAGGSLAELRGPLRPGQVVTVLAPVARALGRCHAAGLAHGRVSADHVLLTADGRPLLTGLGHPPAGAGPVEDVEALTALGLALLGDGPGAAAVRDALDGGSATPPTADRLAALLLTAVAPEPLVLQAPTGSPPASAVHDDRAGSARRRLRTRDAGPSAPVRRRPTRRDVLAWLALLLLVTTAATAWRATRSGPVPPALPPVAATASPAEPAPAAASWPGQAATASSWAQVLDGLHAQRERALAAADPGLLDDVWLTGSPGLGRDRAAVLALRSAGQRVVGARHVVEAVHVLTASSDEARLRVVDALRPHEVRARDGTRVRAVAGRGASAYEVRVVRRDGRWLLADVRPVSG
jgi:eukaryotic-like serine/threonine-protein kinase